MELVLTSRPARPLTVIGFHDTNNWKMRADGALVVERPEKDRMPPFCNFGNQGDFLGNAKEGKTLLTPAAEMRCIARAWAEAFDQAAEQDFLKPKDFAYMEPVSFNRPYDGGQESFDSNSITCPFLPKIAVFGRALARKPILTLRAHKTTSFSIDP